MREEYMSIYLSIVICYHPLFLLPPSRMSLSIFDKESCWPKYLIPPEEGATSSSISIGMEETLMDWCVIFPMNGFNLWMGVKIGDGLAFHILQHFRGATQTGSRLTSFWSGASSTVSRNIDRNIDRNVNESSINIFLIRGSRNGGSGARWSLGELTFPQLSERKLKKSLDNNATRICYMKQHHIYKERNCHPLTLGELVLG